MASRGPDGAGLWLDASRRVGLAHRRLSVIDPTPSAAQPMTLDGARLVITFSGEIYNYRVLRRELEVEGRRFRTESDTEVLLHLYDREGSGMVSRLRGMFALAIWDSTRRGLFLARDGFGIKPLYYADTGGVLRFASQVKALLAGDGISTKPSAAGRAGFFVWGSVPEPWTFFETIRCLPAGCTLWVDGGGVRPLARHFDLAAELAQAEAAPATGASEKLRAAVQDTVRQHLVGDVPVGAFLSVGRDSATVVAHAAEFAPDPLQTVTWSSTSCTTRARRPERSRSGAEPAGVRGASRSGTSWLPATSCGFCGPGAALAAAAGRAGAQPRPARARHVADDCYA